MSMTPDVLRQVMRTWAASVAIVTASHEGTAHGMTINSFTSISLDPPLITITMQINTRTHDLVTRSGQFALTFLDEDQIQISNRFAGRVPDSGDRLSSLELTTLASDTPVLANGIAHLECKIVHQYATQHSTLFVAEVLAARIVKDAPPLLYYNREYKKLAK